MNADENTQPPSTSSTQPSSISALWPEREWEKLLTLIGEQRVVPVIGPELLCVAVEEDPAVRLYDLWGRTLAQQRGIEVTAGSGETPLLYRIANQLSVDPEMQAGDLEYDIDAIIRGQSWPLPESLRLLAQIPNFPLYLTTTIDHLMARALREAGRPPLEVKFKRGGDLPMGFEPGQAPALFYLFGAACTDPDGFAATEDALIEFSWSLIGEYAPHRLYDLLRKKTLLLLGCDFPDWLERFFVHALTRRPEAQIAVDYVSASRQNGLYDFLRRKRAKPLPHSPVEFVAELHRRWQQRQQPDHSVEAQPSPAVTPTESKRGAVFISYAREDLAAARAIRAQLEAQNLDTWMDESGLEPGAEFQSVIQDNIRNASFFLALISRRLELNGTDRLGRFVLKEWKWAEDVNLERRKDDRFLQPVLLDDTPAGAEFIDRPFRDLHWTSLADGKLPPEFIDFLRKGIRGFRGSRGGADR